MMELAGRNILVVGLGASGCEAAAVAGRLGASVVAVDRSRTPSRMDRVGVLESLGVEVRLGVSVPGDLSRFELVVASPGVPDSSEVLTEARRKDVRVWSELELGYRLLGNKMVAVTGTNGKTTTTELVGSLLDKQGRRAVTCGNIGNPLVGLYGKVQPEDILVVEASSFQLQNIEEFKARVGIVLNVSPDHFDWHSDFDEYRSAKMRLVENQGERDFLIYNADDEFCLEMARRCPGVTAGFTTMQNSARGLWLDGGWIMAGEPFLKERVLPVEEINLKGVHNIENVMASCGAALAMGEDSSYIRNRVRRFKSLEHRMEFVREVEGVSFYNDSKATNPHATLQALRSFDEPTVLIMGGRNKGLSFDDLMAEVAGRFEDGGLEALVLIGESAEELRRTLDAANPEVTGARVLKAGSMQDAVQKAFSISSGSGVVLLSPACASFDMFFDYEDRGRAFKECVSGLEGSEALGNGR